MRVYLVSVSTLVLLAGGIAIEDDEAAGHDSKPACSLPEEHAEPTEEFECRALEEFPEEEYEQALNEDEKTRELVNNYEQVDADSAECPTAPVEESQEASDRLLSSEVTKWISLCPTWSYTICKWEVTIEPWGRCWVVTPITVTRCATKSCRWVYPWFLSRCREVYQKVYFLAFCPESPWLFVWSYKYIYRCCSCQRLVCGNIHA